MPLGFGPVSSSPVGGSPRLGVSSQQAGGAVALVNPAGLSATLFLSSVTASIRVRPTVSLSGMTTTLGILGSLSATSPKMTTFTVGFAVTATLGSDFTGGSLVAIDAASPGEVTVLLGTDFNGFAPTATVSMSTTITSSLGAVGSGDPWVEILPVTSPGWTEIVTQ